MKSIKGSINFNKIRNQKDKVKARLKRKKPEKIEKVKRVKNKKRVAYTIFSLITGLAILFILGVILFTIFIIVKAPEFDEKLLFDKDSTVIYDKDGEIIATLGMNAGNDNVEKRIKLSYEELPEVLIDALVATEDSRFFQHNGVDVARFLKASFGQMLGKSDAGGASTLTMQLSKTALTNTTSEGIEGIIRKFTDIYLAVFKIEKQYTKQDIIEMYLNSEFLGNESFGVEQASKTYFGKSASDLSLSEAALLAGLFQAPVGYDPYVYPEDAEARRNLVLNLMVRHGYITEEIADIAKEVHVADMIKTSTSSGNPYQGYVDTVIEEVIDKYDVNPYKVPLEIYTYFDKSKQDVINALYDGTAGYTFKDDQVKLGIAVIDNANGSLIAVGAHRDNTGERGWNYATMINKHPGSTIKPILDYGPAIEYLNWSTYTPLFDEETKYTGGGVINNWNSENDGLITAKKALSKSMNTCALQTFRATTNKQKWDFSTALGITPGNSNGVINESAAIGAFEGTNPRDMAAAYSAFANGGYYTEPHSVQKIVYKESGDVDEKTYERQRVMKATTAYLISNILLEVTPSAARVNGTQIATKTGTSSYDNDTLKREGLPSTTVMDVWAASFNPDYTIAFWYGYDELSKDTYTTFATSSTERNKIEAVLNKGIMTTKSTFKEVKGVRAVEVELETIPARLASEFTPKELKEKHYFISGTEPTEVSTRFSKLEDPKNINVIETNTSAKVTWDSPAIPNAINDEYLLNYFNAGYGEWAEKYYTLRQEYNTEKIGEYGFDVYLRSGSDLTFVGRTTDTEFIINNTEGYDSVVVKSSYSIFKDNASDGIGAELKGETTTFKVELQAIETPAGPYIHPTYEIGQTIPNIGVETVKFLINDVDATSSLDQSSMTYTIKNCTSACINESSINNTKQGEYEITYTIIYLGETFKETRYVHIKEHENETD